MSVPDEAVRLRPLGMGEILDAAFKIYRNHFGTLTLCVLVVAVPLAIVDTLIGASTDENAFNFSLTEEEALESDFDTTMIGGLFASLVLNVISFAVTTAACFRAVGSGYLGQPVSWTESLGFAARRLGPMLWVLVMMGALLVLGFVACIVPGIWLGVAFAVALPALLFEDVRGSKALRRSFNLVKDRWWSTFGTLIVITIIVTVIQAVLGGLIGLTLLAGSDNEVLVAVVLTVFTIVGTVFSTPIQAAVFALVYFDLRVRKEAFDLQLLAERMGAGPVSPDAIAAQVAKPPAPSPFLQPGAGAPPPEGGFLPPSAPPPPPPPPPPPERPPDPA